MSTMEKLLVQIFERKKWIVNQAKHQTFLFEQHLASKCLIDGIALPPWLLSSSSPDNVLYKQDLISGVPLPRTQSKIPLNGSYCPIFDTTIYDEVPNGFCPQVGVLDKGLPAQDQVLISPKCTVSNAGCSSSNGIPQEQREEDQRDGRISNVYNDPARSPATGAGDEVSILPHYSISNAGCSFSSVPQYQIEVDPTLTSPEREGRISDNYHDPAQSLARVQRSKSRQRALAIRNSDNKVRSQEKNNFNGSDGGTTVSSLLSDYVDELNLVIPSDTSFNTSEVEEANVGDFHSKERGISISGRSFGQQKSSLNVSGSACIDKEKGSISHGLSELVDHSHITYDSCQENKKEKGSRASCQRTRSSRSAGQQPNCELLKLEHSSKSINGDGARNSMQQLGLVNEMVEVCKLKSFDIIDASSNHCGRITRSGSSSRLPNNASHLPKPDTSFGFAKGDGGTLNNSTGMSAQLQPLSWNAGDHDEHAAPASIIRSFSDENYLESHVGDGEKHSSEVSSKVKEVPGTQNNELAEAATHRETEIGSGGSFQTWRIHSGCNLDGTELRVGAGVLVPRQRAGCNLFVNAKQVNCDDVEEYSLNGSSSLTTKNGLQGRSAERRSLFLMLAEDVLDEELTVNYQEDCNSPMELNFPEYQEVSVKENKLQIGLSKAPAVELCKSSSALNGNAVSSVKETSDVHNDAAANTLLESDMIQNGYPNALQVADEILVESLVKYEVMGSNLADVSPGEEESAPASYAVGNPIIPTESDFSMVSSPHSRVQDAKNLTVENSCPASTNETKGNLAQLIRNSHNSPKWEQWSISNKRGVGYSKSTECHHADKFKRRSLSSFMEGSWPQRKRRKIEHKIADDLLASPDLIEKVSDIVNRNCVLETLGSVENFPDVVLESQGLSISRENVVKSVVSRSPVEETDENGDHHMLRMSESSPKAQMKHGESSLGRGDRILDAPFTFMHEKLEAPLLLSLMKQTAGHPQDCLMEETGVARPADAGGQCIEGNLASHPLVDSLTVGNAENLTAGRATQEMRFDLGTISKFSGSLVGSPHGQPLELIGAHDTKPELEGFILDKYDEPKNIAGKRISFDEWNLAHTTIERASILEQLCKSACMQTPVACSSSSYKMRKVPDPYQYVPTGFLDGVDMRTTFLINGTVKQLKDGHSCLSDEVGQASYGMPYSDFLSNCRGQSGWDIKKPCISPVGKLWDRTGSSTSSSGKRRSLNPELPCISEENENTDEVADTFKYGMVSEVLNDAIQRVPLADITEIPNPPTSVSVAECSSDRFSLDSINTDFTLMVTHKNLEQKPGAQDSSRKRYNNKENLAISRRTNDLKGTTGSLHNRFSKPKLSQKSSFRRGGPSLSEQESKRNNVVSNMASFIPLVQRKQAAAVVKGKRDIKVKALEAAEAAKRITEKKENDRKMKKEALKLERSRIEQENMRQLEMQKKKKEEERRKKEADMEAKKRHREEEDKKEKERKRMRVEARRHQREQEDKLPAEREGKEIKCQAIDGGRHGSKEYYDEAVLKQTEEERANSSFRKISETDPMTSGVATSNARRKSIIHQEVCESPSNRRDNPEVQSNLDQAKSSVENQSQDQSYAISPYRESDDENEDDDDDDMPNSKFIPSWSSKSCLALAVSCQNGAGPDLIFPSHSFCSISEVLLPRKLQLM